MKLWWVTRNLAAVAALTAAMLLLIYAMLSAGIEQWLVPTPESTAESLVQAFSAHRYEAIPSLMHSDARPQVREAELARWIKAIEEARGGIESVEASASTQSAESASVTLEIHFADKTQQSVTLPLAKEKYLWRVTSIDGLAGLAGPGS
jgi:cytosine/adenosine deaminase-related metal-dependent hydrolase